MRRLRFRHVLFLHGETGNRFGNNSTCDEKNTVSRKKKHQGASPRKVCNYVMDPFFSKKWASVETFY